MSRLAAKAAASESRECVAVLDKCKTLFFSFLIKKGNKRPHVTRNSSHRMSKEKPPRTRVFGVWRCLGPGGYLKTSRKPHGYVLSEHHADFIPPSIPPKIFAGPLAGHFLLAKPMPSCWRGLALRPEGEALCYGELRARLVFVGVSGVSVFQLWVCVVLFFIYKDSSTHTYMIC